MTTGKHPAIRAVEDLAHDHDRAIDLLDQFCKRFYWIKDHPDYQKEVRQFLESHGRTPRPYDH